MSAKRKRQKARSARRSAAEPLPATPAAALSWSDLWVALLVFVAACGGFANSLGNGFVYDDVGIIETNPRLEHPGDLYTFFTTSYWGESLPNMKLYRPLTLMSFALDRAVFGPGPFGVHLMNVMANGLVAGLAYALVRRLFGRRDLALVTALLFAIHPVHTEVVANGVGRAELYAVLSMLLALHMHLSFATAQRRRARYLYLLGAVLLYLAALLFKESAVVLPGLIFLMEWLIVQQGRLRAMLRRVGWYLVYVLPLVVYVAARVPVVGTDPPAPQEVMVGCSDVQRVLYASETTLRYLGQLAFPWWLCAEYADYTNLIRPAVTDPLVLASLLAWALGAALVVLLARRRQYLILFAAGWFFLTLLPVSNLLVPIGTVRADRLLFVPSLGFALVAAYGLMALARWRRPAGYAAVVLVLGFYAWRTAERNRVWYSHDALWAVTVRDNPGSAVAWLAIGCGHQARDELDQAVQAFERACELPARAGFCYGDAHLKCAVVLRQRDKPGDRAAAAGHYRAVLREQPRHRTALMNLGELLYRDAATCREAIELFRRAVAEDRRDFRGYANLAQACRHAGDYAAALQALDSAIELNPAEPRLWDVKAVVLREAGRRADEVRQAQEEAARLRDLD